jgi:uracil-DNA glycosylase family 4
MDVATRNRMKIWLRSERAFGLSAVPWRPAAGLTAPAELAAGPTGGLAGELAGELAAGKRSERHLTPPTPPSLSSAARSVPPKSEYGNREPAGAETSRPKSTRAESVRPEPTRFESTRSEPAVTVPSGELIPMPSTGSFSAPLLPTKEKTARLVALDANEVSKCTKCRLCETRTNTVFGEGDVDAKVFFIGEGPGENEDLQGRPFVGRAGEMLNKWIAAMGLRREDVYIANIVKCRPPGNRVPMPDEVATCTPYLERQLEIIRPRVIVTLGLPSLKYMMNDPKLAMGKSRGIWRDWRGMKLMPTFHPAYVLRSPTAEVRGAVWSDLKLVLAELGMKIPQKS